MGWIGNKDLYGNETTVIRTDFPFQKSFIIIIGSISELLEG